MSNAHVHPLFAALLAPMSPPDPCTVCDAALVCEAIPCPQVGPEDINDPGYGDPQDMRLEAYPEDWKRDLAMADVKGRK
jgi:hypothetical protein